MGQAETLTAEDILERLEQHTDALRRMGVQRIGLFGSHRRGEARPASDIDILVTLADDTFDTYATVKLFLEDLFEREVDLVVEDALKPRLRPYILSEVEYAEGL